jgi:hypothetical protein
LGAYSALSVQSTPRVNTRSVGLGILARGLLVRFPSGRHNLRRMTLSGEICTERWGNRLQGADREFGGMRWRSQQAPSYLSS